MFGGHCESAETAVCGGQKGVQYRLLQRSISLCADDPISLLTIPLAFMLTMPASFTPLKTSSSTADDTSGFEPTIQSAQRWR